MNCHECKHHRELPGDCHLLCAHPRLPVLPFVLASMYRIYSGKAPICVGDAEAICIQISAFGFNRGWAYWPANYDPRWIIGCSGFESKTKEQTP